MRINENLVLYSAREQVRNTFLAGYYEMAEDLVAGETYTISFEGSWSGGNLAIFQQDGYHSVATNPDYKKIGSRYSFTFKIGTIFEERGRKNIISLYNFPNDGNEKRSSLKRVKLEKGSEATLYIPNKADLEDSSLYPTKVGGYLGGNTSHLGGVACVS